jgi:hypothetical protein
MAFHISRLRNEVNDLSSQRSNLENQIVNVKHQIERNGKPGRNSVQGISGHNRRDSQNSSASEISEDMGQKMAIYTKRLNTKGPDYRAYHSASESGSENWGESEEDRFTSSR